MTNDNVIHHTEQTELNRILEQDKCNHNFQYQGELTKYFAYACAECDKVYWVNKKDKKSATEQVQNNN